MSSSLGMCLMIVYFVLIYCGTQAYSLIIQNRNKIDLSHLGARMYGKPRADVGREVDRYYQNFQFDKNPEELGRYADGDILIPRPTPKNGVVGESYRWPNGVIPFEIRGTFSKFANYRCCL